MYHLYIPPQDSLKWRFVRKVMKRIRTKTASIFFFREFQSLTERSINLNYTDHCTFKRPFLWFNRKFPFSDHLNFEMDKLLLRGFIWSWNRKIMHFKLTSEDYIILVSNESICLLKVEIYVVEYMVNKFFSCQFYHHLTSSLLVKMCFITWKFSIRGSK